MTVIKRPATADDLIAVKLAKVGPQVCFCCLQCVQRALETLREAGFEVRET